MIKTTGYVLLGGVMFTVEVVVLCTGLLVGMCLSFLFAGAMGDK